MCLEIPLGGGIGIAENLILLESSCQHCKDYDKIYPIDERSKIKIRDSKVRMVNVVLLKNTI